MAQCGICGHPIRNDKLKQHLLSHAHPKGRDSRGRFSSQERMSPDGVGVTPYGSVSGGAPRGGSPMRGQKNDPMKACETLEGKRAAVGALAQAIIERLTELQCDKILGIAKERKWPFTP